MECAWQWLCNLEMERYMLRSKWHFAGRTAEPSYDEWYCLTCIATIILSGLFVQLRADIFQMKAPSPLTDNSDTHTEIMEPWKERVSEQDISNRPLMYNESIRLTVRPGQNHFIEQEPDMFYVRQLDVVCPRYCFTVP
jgi:hypothetical protein